MITTSVGRRRALLLLFAVVAALSSSRLCSDDQAQNEKKNEKPYALLFGTVLDKTDHPVFGVKIEIRGAASKKQHWEAISDHAGEFAQRVPAGASDYVISAETKGKGPRPQVTVHVANDERVDFFLHLTE